MPSPPRLGSPPARSAGRPVGPGSLAPSFVPVTGDVTPPGRRTKLAAVHSPVAWRRAAHGPGGPRDRGPPADPYDLLQGADVHSTTRGLAAAAALAAAFGDHWVLLDPAKAGKVTPFASYFTIGGFADAFLGLLRAAGAFNSTSTATVAGQPAVRLRSTAGLCDVAATGKPYPLRLELPGGRVELSQYDRPVAIRAPSGALKAS